MFCSHHLQVLRGGATVCGVFALEGSGARRKLMVGMNPSSTFGQCRVLAQGPPALRLALSFFYLCLHPLAIRLVRQSSLFRMRRPVDHFYNPPANRRRISASDPSLHVTLARATSRTEPHVGPLPLRRHILRDQRFRSTMQLEHGLTLSALRYRAHISSYT
jgi:hypothetical protein